MRFPNAFSGVKKIFAAEILQIIGVVAMGLAVAFLVLLSESVNADNAVTGVGNFAFMSIFAIGGAVVLIVAAILKIVGLVKAGKDEKSFKYALYLIIVGVIASVVASFFQSSNTFLYNIFDTVFKVADLLSTILIIQGIMTLAANLGDDVMVEKGATIFKVIIGIYVFAILGTIAYAILFPLPLLRVIGIVCYCISVFLSITSYVLFIAYLSKAKKMLG